MAFNQFSTHLKHTLYQIALRKTAWELTPPRTSTRWRKSFNVICIGNRNSRYKQSILSKNLGQAVLEKEKSPANMIGGAFLSYAGCRTDGSPVQPCVTGYAFFLLSLRPNWSSAL